MTIRFSRSKIEKIISGKKFFPLIMFILVIGLTGLVLYKGYKDKQINDDYVNKVLAEIEEKRIATGNTGTDNNASPSADDAQVKAFCSKLGVNTASFFGNTSVYGSAESFGFGYIQQIAQQPSDITPEKVCGQGVTTIIRPCVGNCALFDTASPEYKGFIEAVKNLPCNVILTGPNEPQSEWGTGDMNESAGRDVGVYMNSLGRDVGNAPNVTLLTPVFDPLNPHTAGMVAQMNQTINWSLMDGMAVNAYNVDKLANEYVNDMKAILGQYAPGLVNNIFVTETGKYNEQYRGVDSAAAVQQLRDAIVNMVNDPAIKGILFFNGFGLNPDANFRYGALSPDLISQITNALCAGGFWPEGGVPGSSPFGSGLIIPSGCCDVIPKYALKSCKESIFSQNGGSNNGDEVTAGARMIPNADGTKWSYQHLVTEQIHNFPLLAYLASTSQKGTTEHPFATVIGAAGAFDTTGQLGKNFTKNFPGIANFELDGPSSDEQVRFQIPVGSLGTASAAGEYAWLRTFSEDARYDQCKASGGTNCSSLRHCGLDFKEVSSNEIDADLGGNKYKNDDYDSYIAKVSSETSENNIFQILYNFFFGQPQNKSADFCINACGAGSTSDGSNSVIPISKCDFSDGYRYNRTDPTGNTGNEFIVSGSPKFPTEELTIKETCNRMFGPKQVVFGGVCKFAKGCSIENNRDGTIRTSSISNCVSGLSGTTISSKDAYSKMLAAGFEPEGIGGDPYHEVAFTRTKYMELEGMLKLLTNIFELERAKQPRSFENIRICHVENIGVNINATRRLYDLNLTRSIEGLSPALGRAVDNSPNFEKDQPYISLYQNIPIQYFSMQGAVETRMCNPKAYDFKTPTSPLATTVGSWRGGSPNTQVTMNFVYPWLGNVPRMLERVSVWTNNFGDTSNEYTALAYEFTNPDPTKIIETLQKMKDKKAFEFKNVFLFPCGYLDNPVNFQAVLSVGLYNVEELTDFKKRECFCGKGQEDPLETYLRQQGMLGSSFAVVDDEGPNQCIETPGAKPTTPTTPTSPDGEQCKVDNLEGGYAPPLDGQYRYYTYQGHAGIDYLPQPTQVKGGPVYAVGGGQVVFVRNLDIKDSKFKNGNPSEGSCADGSYVNNTCDWANIDEEKDEYYGWGKGLGNVVGIKHGDAITIYAHLDVGSITVKEGDCVQRNQQIGKVGNNGYSFAPHLHFEVRKLNCSAYTQSCVFKNDPATVTTAPYNERADLGTPRIPTSDPIPPGSNEGDKPYCYESDDPGDVDDIRTVTPVTGTPTADGVLGLVEKAAQSLNSNGQKMAPEILYAILKQETSLRCPGTWDSWRYLGDRTECNGDPNQTSFASKNRVAWDGRINNGTYPVDVRGISQFAAYDPETEKYCNRSGGCKVDTFNSIVSNYRDAMLKCITDLGVSNPIAPGSVNEDPFSVDKATFSRHRVADGICAAAIKLAEDGRGFNGSYLSVDQWLDLNGVGGSTLQEVSRRYHGSCGLNYCANTRRFAQGAIDDNLFK